MCSIVSSGAVPNRQSEDVSTPILCRFSFCDPVQTISNLPHMGRNRRVSSLLSREDLDPTSLRSFSLKSKG
ncbi:hypothetical protein GE061_013558 [Apolygus lucorum]|uniref:Uncharacterized protein n=1 Tax=Apolygus lucorum TaxID=248454 RepID=A0A8S9XN16_APOLU|nr:hypothetical protein GE061_013558 [Apolygus lucorum]